MNDVFGVGGGEGGGYLAGESQGVSDRKLAAKALHPRAERLAFQKLHHDVRRAVGLLAKFGNLDDARMVDDVDGARLVQKALHDLRIFGEVRVQDFDRGPSLDLLVDGLVDIAHAAFAEQSRDLVGADLARYRPGCRGSVWHEAPFLGTLGLPVGSEKDSVAERL